MLHFSPVGGQWIVVGWIFCGLFVQIYTLSRNPTRIRVGCLISTIINLALAILNALRVNGSSDDGINIKLYILIFSFATAFFINLGVGLQLHIGRNFYPHTKQWIGADHNLILFWAVLVTAFIFTVICLGNGI